MPQLSWAEWYKQDLARQEELSQSKQAGMVPMAKGKAKDSGKEPEKDDEMESEKPLKE